MPGPGLDPAEVYAKVFTRALRGYATPEVDELLQELGDELTRRQRGSTPRTSAEDVRQVTFGTVRHGYAVLEVDDFLDRAAAELDQLRAGGHSAMTAANVRAARFAKVTKGYAMPEVDSYLDDLAAEFDQLAPPAPLPPAPKPQLSAPRFKVALRGYATREVNELLARIEAEFERLRGALERRSPGYVAELTASDVNQAEFNRGLRGYAMDEVDDFLDEVAAELTRLQEALQARDPRP